MNILITGGAGYIGSHVAKQLLETTSYNIIILDNLSTGSLKTLDTLKTIREFKFVELDLKEFDKVNRVLKENKINTIIHFAASIVVPESVENPLNQNRSVPIFISSTPVSLSLGFLRSTEDSILSSLNAFWLKPSCSTSFE